MRGRCILLFAIFVLSKFVLSKVTAEGLAPEARQADQAEQAGETDRAIEILKQVQSQGHHDPQIEKRLSRLYSRKIEDTNVSGERKNYADLAVTLGEDAVRKLPDDAQAHIGLAAAYGELCDVVDSPRARVEYSKRVYHEVTRGLELDPASDFGHLILARWNFEMATTNPVLRGVAQVVYGQFPPASKEQALENFKQAIALAPYRVIHHAEYAKVLEAIGDASGAREQWQKVLELKAIDAQDRRYRALAAARLNK